MENVHFGKDYDANMWMSHRADPKRPPFHMELIVAISSSASEIIYVWHPWRATLAFVVAESAHGIQTVL